MTSCDYCGRPAQFVDAKTVNPESGRGMVWYCPDCSAWVGVHPNSTVPNGRLANAELRFWKKKGHQALDPYVRGKSRYIQGMFYKWLALEMGHPNEPISIGSFDVAQWKEVIQILKRRSTA